MARTRAISIQDQNGDTPSLIKNFEKKLRTSINQNKNFIFSMEGFNSVSIQLWNNVANPFIQILTSNDGIFWTPLQFTLTSGFVNSSAGFRLSNNNPQIITANKVGNYVQIIQTNALSYTICNIILGQSFFSNVNNISQFSQDNVIRYVAPSAINTTGSVTLASATSPSFSSCISSMQISNGGTGESELIIKQGSTVILRTFVTAKQPVSSLSFSPTITDNSSNAITAELVTATSMSLYINTQGLILSKNN